MGGRICNMRTMSNIALLFSVILLKTAQTMGQQQAATVSPDPKPVSSLEREVLGFRLWMILAFVFVGLAIIIIVLCCVFDCRIPRTKQEIDADYERKQLAEKYVKEMEKIPKNKTVKIVRARPGNVLPGSVFRDSGPPYQTLGRAREAGTSGEGQPLSDATPLAQHPASMMSSTVERKLRNTADLKLVRPGQVATAKMLASLGKERSKTTQANTPV